MACNRQEVRLSELRVSPGLKAYECMNKSEEDLFSSSPPACKITVQQEGREIRDGQQAQHMRKGMREVQRAQHRKNPKQIKMLGFAQRGTDLGAGGQKDLLQ